MTNRRWAGVYDILKRVNVVDILPHNTRSYRMYFDRKLDDEPSQTKIKSCSVNKAY